MYFPLSSLIWSVFYCKAVIIHNFTIEKYDSDFQLLQIKKKRPQGAAANWVTLDQ